MPNDSHALSARFETTGADTGTSDVSIGFVSDNTAGAHPRIMQALEAANSGCQHSYGHDQYTAELDTVMQRHFGPNAQTYCVFNGTGANVLALQAMTRRWEAVICSEGSHLSSAEGGAPERLGGIALKRLSHRHGKIDVEQAMLLSREIGDEHRAQPAVLSVAQATEYGTCYGLAEMRTLCSRGHAAGFAVHMDGARLSNAAAALGASLRELTTDAGVDVVSFGGTKNGLMFGDCVVVLNPRAVAGISFLRKSTTQLPSKARYVAAQFIELMRDDLWLRNADHANAMARLLSERVRHISGASVSRPVRTNAVFATVSPAMADQLRARDVFYQWDADSREVRWMTSFRTTAEDVDAFAKVIQSAADACPILDR